jgi:pilus assembly protein CpaC
VVGSLGVPNVDFKKFGIQLEFTPVVLANQTIELKTSVSISVLDKSQNLTIAGIDLPLFSTRASSTTVRLRSGQSFAVAGLLQDQLENVIDKMPGLGELPILGMLFNSRKYQRRETELVVVVSARLVNPLNGAEIPSLPGETGSRDPNDVGVFLMNIFEESAPAYKGAGSTAQLPQRRAAFTPSGPMGFWR